MPVLRRWVPGATARAERDRWKREAHATYTALTVWSDDLLRAEAELERVRVEHREFVDGLTAALQAHGVPAMPSWRDAIDYLARNGGA